MQTVDMSKCIEGIFVKELKNRFLCEVLISGISSIGVQGVQTRLKRNVRFESK